MRRRASFRLSCALFAALLLVSFQACKGREAPSGLAKIPGALPVALKSMSGDSLVAFAATLHFVSDTTFARRCDDDAGCAGDKPAQTARVSISATEGAWVTGPGSLPANGVIMGRARSTGHREARYGFKPGAAFEYYLIVLPGAGPSGASWQIEEVSSVAGQRAHRTLSQGPYTSCNHAPWQKAPAIPVGFYSCANSPHLAPSGTKSSLMLADPSLTDPVWYACSMGCCSMAS